MSLTITLPDGSQQSVPDGARPLDVAKSVSPRLAADAIVARVNGELFDLTRPLESDANVEILTTKNPEALQVYRHSTAHLLAAAVLELFDEPPLLHAPSPSVSATAADAAATPLANVELGRVEVVATTSPLLPGNGVSEGRSVQTPCRSEAGSSPRFARCSRRIF